MAIRLYLRDTTAIGLDGRKDLAAAKGSATQTSTLTGPAPANTLFPGMRFVSGRMPSGGVDFAGATVSIAIGGSETSLVLNAAAQFRIRSHAPDGALADFLLVGPTGEFGGSTVQVTASDPAPGLALPADHRLVIDVELAPATAGGGTLDPAAGRNCTVAYNATGASEAYVEFSNTFALKVEGDPDEGEGGGAGSPRGLWLGM
jgi:hypothetical protein